MAGTQEIEQQQWTESRPDVHAFEMAFDEAEATQLLTAAQTGDAVVAITQQADADGDALHETNFATVLRIPAPKANAAGVDAPLPPELNVVLVGNYRAAASTTPPGKDCSSTNMRPGADLSGCDLRGADFRGADFRGADLSYANLSGTSLVGVNLSLANLSYANLSGSDARSLKLGRANLSYANLTRAFLVGAILLAADLSYADLRGADLSYASLTFAILRGADLRDTIGFRRSTD
jgi:uncharacterized protein YjbI with pentapeptide repeats